MPADKNSLYKAAKSLPQHSGELAEISNSITNPLSCRQLDLDDLSRLILHILQDHAEPLETREIEEACARFHRGVTRIKVFYRLQNLRAEGLIRGKFIGSGKGNWIWFRPISHAPERLNGALPRNGGVQNEALG